MKEIELQTTVDVNLRTSINLCEAKVYVAIGERKEEEAAIPLIDLFREEMECLRSGGDIAKYAEKGDWNLKGLKSCAKILNDLIKDIEDMP